MLRRALLASLGLLAVLAVPASAKDYASTALNIVPSGEYGGVPVPGDAGRQAEMYDGLTPLFNQVTTPDLTKYFKSEALGAAGTPGPTRVERTPRKGLKIVRDSFNVPHLTGKRRSDAIWGAGWVAREDRGLLLAEARYASRFAALDAPGISSIALITGLKQVKTTAQTDRIIEREQTRALKRRGKEGRAMLRDIDTYVAGVNARRKFEKSKEKPYTRVDVYAATALAGQLFGQGGGDEVRRSQLLDGLQKRLGTAQAQQVFDDVSQHQDGDTPVSIGKSFPYENIPAGRSGNAIIDAGSVTNAKAIAYPAAAKRYASNFLMVSGSRSATGHPLLVGGPQIGYYYPGLTFELEVNAPGMHVRGVSYPGLAAPMLIGRGEDFAWTLTSAGSDTNDQFVETLCGGLKTKYLYKGKCRRMGRVNAGRIGGVGTVKYLTTVHGPVQGYATSGGRKVAISFDRSSHGRDALWQIIFRRFSHGQVTGLRSFYSAAATSPYTFNVGYADDKNIAMYSAGRLPIRDKRVDPRLPTKGTGKYDWKGFLSAKKHPREANPASGALVNWNNMPAPGFGPADEEWDYGSTHRVQMLNAGVAARQTHDPASLTSAMNAAATQDLRVVGSTFDGIAGVLNTGPAPSSRARQMLDLLETWRAQGGSRLDRDLDGKMDAGAAPAIMDAVYPKIADAVTGGVFGPQLDEYKKLEGATNGPASGFTGGRISIVDKDLRQLLGQDFQKPFKTRFCGGGDLAACRDALWAAFEQAGNELAAAQGTPDPAAWTSDANAERIKFVPGLLQTTIRYTNRPSGIQQVISFSGHRKTRR
jgi:acyl-homoserine lactone acylase PvdQ